MFSEGQLTERFGMDARNMLRAYETQLKVIRDRVARTKREGHDIVKRADDVLTRMDEPNMQDGYWQDLLLAATRIESDYLVNLTNMEHIGQK